jgi:hypothetical protein
MVVDHNFVAGAQDSPGHVRAHPSESDHSKLHGVDSL